MEADSTQDQNNKPSMSAIDPTEVPKTAPVQSALSGEQKGTMEVKPEPASSNSKGGLSPDSLVMILQLLSAAQATMTEQASLCSTACHNFSSLEFAIKAAQDSMKCFTLNLEQRVAAIELVKKTLVQVSEAPKEEAQDVVKREEVQGAVKEEETQGVVKEEVEGGGPLEPEVANIYEVLSAAQDALKEHSSLSLDVVLHNAKYVRALEKPGVALEKVHQTIRQHLSTVDELGFMLNLDNTELRKAMDVEAARPEQEE